MSHFVWYLNHFIFSCDNIYRLYICIFYLIYVLFLLKQIFKGAQIGVTKSVFLESGCQNWAWKKALEKHYKCHMMTKIWVLDACACIDCWNKQSKLAAIYILPIFPARTTCAALALLPDYLVLNTFLNFDIKFEAMG